MDKPVTGELHRTFREPADLFAGLSPDAAALLTASGADIALVLAKDGTVLNLAYADKELEQFGVDDWQGKPWVDTVTVESREKIDALLADSNKVLRTRARQVNHATPGRADLPLSYVVLSPPDIEHKVAFGHNLKMVAETQQRLVNIQIEMEEDYRRIRDAESRYRVLFQLAAEPLIVADAVSMKIADVNEAACAFFDKPAKKMIGSNLFALFARDMQAAVQELAAEIRSRGRPESLDAGFVGIKQRRMTHFSPFRETGKTSLLVRIADGAVGRGRAERPEADSLVSFFQHQPDGAVLVDKDGRIVTANVSFLELVRIVNVERIVSKRLDNWLGGSFVDVQVLISNLREHGSVRRFSTVVRDELGGITHVDVSATHIPQAGSDGAVYGFSIREASRQEFTPSGMKQVEQAYSPAYFSELVGRVPLKELVRETADIIEKMCIEAALRMTDNNRASAADMLGLSRQSLYLKLRRYDIDSFNPEDDEES